MPVYNTAPYVEEAVRSVLAQTFTDFELLVVDDGSTDGSADIVRSIGDPRIRIIRTEHVGLAGAENVGLAAARGRYLARVDSDDVVLPDLFAKQVAVLDRFDRTAAVCAWTRRFGFRQALDRPPTDPKAIRRALRRWWVLSQPVMYRTEAVRSAGGFRPMQSEDWDLWIRLAKRNDLRVVPECLGLIRTRPASMTMRLSRVASRADKLKMRLIALRHLGADPLSLLVLAKSVGVWGVYLVLDRILPPKRPRPEPARTRPAVSVVTLARGDVRSLAARLRAIEQQRPGPDEVLVVVERGDTEAIRFLSEWQGGATIRRVLPVERLDTMAAFRTATAAASREVVAYLDDDALPEPGWLEELCRGFLDPFVGAVGGPVVDGERRSPDARRAHRVGHISWYGRTVWGHENGGDHYGPVTFLSASNMAIRRSLAAFDPRLLRDPDGRACGTDVDLCLTVRRAGYRVLFSPWARARELHPSETHAIELPGPPDAVTVAAANRTYALLKHLSRPRRAAAVVYGYVVGSARVPAPIRALAELPRHPRAGLEMLARVPDAWRGRRLASRMFHEHRRGEVVALPAHPAEGTAVKRAS